MNKDQKIIRIQLAVDNVRKQHHGRLPKAAAKHYGSEIIKNVRKVLCKGLPHYR